MLSFRKFRAPVVPFVLDPDSGCHDLRNPGGIVNSSLQKFIRSPHRCRTFACKGIGLLVADEISVKPSVAQNKVVELDPAFPV